MTRPIGHKDYTKWPLGEKVFERIPDIDPHTGEDIGEIRGEIKVCPRCGRHGLAQLTKNGWTYTHSETITPKEDGTFFVNWDTCPKTSPREEHR
jgi:hypothetical protein